MKICVSIASYRDPDLINTVNSAYENATNKENISFCIISQAEDDEHPDLAHIPQLYYYKYHWSESKGLGWARNLAITKSKGDYILQIDSHSRFIQGWDDAVESIYQNAISYWGEKIMLTSFPGPMEIIDGEEVYIDYDNTLKTIPRWNMKTESFELGTEWEEVNDSIHGDCVYYLAGGCTFAAAGVYKTVPPDPEIYFEDQVSTAIRAFCKGLRLINMPQTFVYTVYDREANNRNLHWEDHEDWYLIEQKSKEKLNSLYRGELKGYWGIGSDSLYEQFAKLHDVYFYVNDSEEDDNEYEESE